MKILKSLGDGVGTGAGVAWPTFGLIFGALGLGINALTTLIIGSLSAALFIFVLLPISYWSYNDYIEHHERTNRKISEQIKQIPELIYNYLLTNLKRCILYSKKNNINDIDTQFLINQMKNEIRKNINLTTYKSPIKQYLTELLNDNNSNHFLMKFISTLDKRESHFNKNDAPVIKHTLNDKRDLTTTISQAYRQRDNFTFSSLGVRSYIKAGAMGFAAGYGSLAGCSAGVLGVLSAIGFFAGLAVIPILGWAILGVSVIFGIITAAICINISAEKHNQKQIYKHYKKINHELEVSIRTSNTKLEAYIEARKRYTHNPKSPIDEDNHKKIKKSYSRTSISKLRNHPIWHSPETSAQEIIKDNSYPVRLNNSLDIPRRRSDPFK